MTATTAVDELGESRSEVGRGDKLRGRVAFVTGIGVLGAILAEAPYWNWYSFPLDYSLTNAVMQIVGFLAAGLVMAWYLKPRVA